MARSMRQALGALAVVVSEEHGRAADASNERQRRANRVPSLVVDIAKLVTEEILPSEDLPSRGQTVAAPVFALLRRTAKSEEATAMAVPRDVFLQPLTGCTGARVSAIGEALAWLDEGATRKAFVHAGAPFARVWLRQVLEWARTNPEAQPPRLPDKDPLAPPPEEGTRQDRARGPRRPKGSTVPFSRTRALALLVLHLVEVEGLPLKTATRRVCNRAKRVHRAAPDTRSLRRAREELKEQGITPEMLTWLAPAIVERFLLPPRAAPLYQGRSRRYGQLLHQYAVAAVLRSLVMRGKNSHTLRSKRRS